MPFAISCLDLLTFLFLNVIVPYKMLLGKIAVKIKLPLPGQ